MISKLKQSLTAQRRSRIAPVTITVGFACREAIIFASDSRATVPENDNVVDAQKLVEVQFLDGKALLAKSGDKIVSDGYEGELARVAATAHLADAQTIASE